MKTLSVRSPEAHLIIYGLKNIENRTWQTKYRGDLLIHSSGEGICNYELYEKSYPKQLKLLSNLKKVFDDDGNVMKNEYCELIDNDIVLKSTDSNMIKEFELFFYMYERAIKNMPALPVKAIIGKVSLVDIEKNHNSQWAEKNCYNWIIEEPIKFNEPILYIKGSLSLWNYPINIEEVIYGQQ